MNLKKLLLLFFVFYSVNSFACSCMPPNFTEKFMRSDFVAVAKIVRVYPNEGDKELYKADIVVLDLFKGENLTSIYIAGRSDGKKGSSCSIFIPENTEMIIYASETDDEKFSFNFCSGYLILNQKSKYWEDKQKQELEMLQVLKAKHINYTNKIWFGKKMGFSEELKRFSGIQLNKSYAIFELTFGADLIIKSVKQISGFGNDFDNELVKILEKSSWVSSDVKSQYDIIRNTVPEGSKVLVGFYFYNAEKEYKSFVGEYDL